jgi:hypothetical protein
LYLATSSEGPKTKVSAMPQASGDRWLPLYTGEFPWTAHPQSAPDDAPRLFRLPTSAISREGVSSRIPAMGSVPWGESPCQKPGFRPVAGGAVKRGGDLADEELRTFTMKPEAARRARIAVLHQEIDATQFANDLYSGLKEHSQEASTEHKDRQERLEEIRRELTELEVRVSMPRRD